MASGGGALALADGDHGSDSGDEARDVEIEIELPRCKVEELLAQLEQGDSDLKEVFPLARIADARALPDGDLADEQHQQQQQQQQQPGPAARAASAVPGTKWDPYERLARLREMQAKYAAVAAQRQRAEATRRVLEVVPSAGDAPAAPRQPIVDPAREAALAQATATTFPPPGGLPFYYRGVPGVIEPRVKPPPEREPDALEDDSWLAEGGAQSARTRMNPDVLLRKDGLDMSLQHLRTHGSRMAAQSREFGRRLEENADMADIEGLQARPELIDECRRRQLLIHEQQRLADELRMDKQVEEERQFWAMREKQIQQQQHLDTQDGEERQFWALRGEQIDRQQRVVGFDFSNAGVCADPAASSAAGPKKHPAMQYMPQPAAGSRLGGPPLSPMSNYALDLPPSRHFQQLLEAEAGAKGLLDTPTESVEEVEPPPAAEPQGYHRPSFFAGFAERSGPCQCCPEASALQAQGQRAEHGGDRSFSAGERSWSPSMRRGASADDDDQQQLLQHPGGRGGAPRPRPGSFGFSERGAPEVGGGKPQRSSRSPRVRFAGIDEQAPPEPDHRNSHGFHERGAPGAGGRDSQQDSGPPQMHIAAFSGFGDGSPASARASGHGAQGLSERSYRSQPSASSASTFNYESHDSRSAGAPIAAFSGDQARSSSPNRIVPQRQGGGIVPQRQGVGVVPQRRDPASPNARREPPRVNFFDNSPALTEVVSQSEPEEEDAGPSLFSSFFGASGGDEDEDSDDDDANELFGSGGSPRPGRGLPPFMVGACLDRKAQLSPPDPDSLIFQDAEEVLLAARDAARLGEQDVAQLALDYLVALAESAEAIARAGEAHRHAVVVADALCFYPLCVQIHLWSVEALIVLFRNVERTQTESLAGPIFDMATELMTTHEADKTLHASVPELPTRLLALFALVLSPMTAGRLRSGHVDFALRVGCGRDVGPILLEHSLQVFMVAKSSHRLREQADAAVGALRSFRAELRLVPRALLALGAAFSVALGSRANATGGDAPGDAGEADGASSAASGARRLLEPAAGQAKAARPEMLPIGLREITGTMDLYAHDRKVQGAGAVALAAAAGLPGISQEALSREGAVRAMVLSQRHFPASRSVALHLCEIVMRIARASPGLLNVELVLQVVQAGTAFAQDAEVTVAALEAVHAFASQLRELCLGPGGRDRLAHVVGDLVQLGEGRHEDPYAMSLLLVVFAAAASDGKGAAPGGAAGEEWRAALGRAAAVALPLRVFYEHPKDPELSCAAAISLRCLTFGSQVACVHAGQLQGARAITAALLRHSRRPDTVRELLTALGNCAADSLVRSDFQKGLPDTNNAIHRAMKSSAPKDPDVLAQGCRALGALLGQESSGGRGSGRGSGVGGSEAASIRTDEAAAAAPGLPPAFDEKRIGVLVDRVVEAAMRREGTNPAGGYFGRSSAEDAMALRKQKLKDVCQELCERRLAGGPVFGRLLGLDLRPTAECIPRHSVTPKKKRAGQ